LGVASQYVWDIRWDIRYIDAPVLRWRDMRRTAAPPCGLKAL